MCTGNADSTAIATIINNFFNSGTAMAMKITITGTMGVAFTSSSAIYINATNTRGAVCYLDFSNCHIPTITTASSDFLNINNSSVKLDVFGLVVRTTKSGINIINSNNCCFDNCNISSAGGLNDSVVINGNGNNKFNNCIFNSDLTCVNISGNVGTINSFNNCIFNATRNGVYHSGNGSVIFTACKIIGSNYGIYTTSTSASIKLISCSVKGSGTTYDIWQNSNASTMKWFIMGNSFAYSSINVNGAIQSVSTATANAYLYMPAYANLFSQTIS